MKKISEQDKIESDNIFNELQEVVEPCIKCGLCKSLCPVFKSLREEFVSPRGHAMLLSDKILDKIVFQCNLCKACELKCPLNIKICDSILKSREILVLNGKELAQNKEMIANIRKTGNPFGSFLDSEISKDKLYCC